MSEPKQQVAVVKASEITKAIEGMSAQFKASLPAHIPTDKFVRTTINAIQNNPDIVKACQTQGGKRSLLSACAKAAADGIVLDGREGVLVTFNTNAGTKAAPVWEPRVQYMIMAQGLMKKARNSGEISSITAELVYDKDSFSYNPATDDVPEHKPDWFGERGTPIGVYAVVKLKDGTKVVEIMNKAQVMAIASDSKNSYQYDPAKGKHYREWWRKTIIRRVCKYIPSSSDKESGESLYDLATRDDAVEFEPHEAENVIEADFENGVVLSPIAEEKSVKKSDEQKNNLGDIPHHMTDDII